MRVATLLFEFPQKVLQETSPACQASEGQNSSSYQKGLSFHTNVYKYCFGMQFLTTAHFAIYKCSSCKVPFTLLKAAFEDKDRFAAW